MPDTIHNWLHDRRREQVLMVDLEKLGKLPIEHIPAMMAEMAAAQSMLAARLLSVEKPKPEPEKPDEYLDVEQAAMTLGVSKEWVYSRSRTNSLPFMARIGRKIKFSKIGIERYIRSSIVTE
jgi:excisionase family DNA binding protein